MALEQWVNINVNIIDEVVCRRYVFLRRASQLTVKLLGLASFEQI